MKTKKYLLPLIIIMGIITTATDCKKESIEPDYVDIQSFTDITENSFVVKWSTNVTNINTINIELALDESFSNIEAVFQVDDPANTTQLVGGLHGATSYYIKIIIESSGGIIQESNIGRTTTSYQSENVSITTEDGLNIIGKIKYLSNNIGKKPAIIFMHQYKSLGNQWNNSDLERKCVSEGWICLILNFRGHFGSDPWPLSDFPSLEQLIEYQRVLGYDLTAAIEFLKSDPNVDSGKLALLGGSLGANMALEGNCNVLTSVGFTCSLVKPDALCAGIPLKSVFYIVGEFDKAGDDIDFYKDTKILYDNTQEPKKLLVEYGSQLHGWSLLTSSIEDQVIDWFNARFSY